MSDETLRVLIVDDDELDRMAVRRTLKETGLPVEVDEAAGPADVLGRVLARRYDCLIVDYMMPGEDGLALVQRLRAAHVRTPILLVSGQGDEVANRVIAAGATDYMPKHDLAPAQLARRLRYAVRVGRAEDRLHSALRDLRAERQLLTAVLRQMPAAVLIAEVPSGVLLMANDQVGELLGYPPATGETMAQLERCHALRPDGGAYASSDWPLARAVRDHEVVTGEEMVCLRAGGDRRLVRASAAPVFDDQGRVVAAVMTMEDLTEERRIQQALERAVSAREEILAIVSHDLRNPLGAVTVAIAELADPTLDDGARARFLAAIRRSTARADRLIRDLLDASRIDAGKLALEKRDLAVHGLLEQAAREHEILARQADTSVTVSVTGAVARVHADRDRVLQALGNLIGNALEYTGGEITLRAEPVGAGVRISVEDRGPGIPEEALPHIFDRYWQANLRRHAGAGLGLAIAKGIVEAHGGTISASNRENGGACFSFTLPGAEAAAVDQSIATE